MFIENRIRKENEQIVVIWKTIKRSFRKRELQFAVGEKSSVVETVMKNVRKNGLFITTQTIICETQARAKLVRTSEAVQAKKSIR